MDDPSGFQRANLNLFIKRAAGVVKPDDATLQLPQGKISPGAARRLRGSNRPTGPG
jgi:hypothetical protein